MNKKHIINTIVVGFALFAMFFGAGNLIFPPYIGLTVGDEWLGAIMGFFITGIGMPILGIIAMAKAGGGVDSLSNKVGNVFSKLYTTIVIVAIGPLLAIPRTGATTYEMGVKPIFGDINPILVSIIYFSITLILSINPTGIVDRIGKILTPILLLMLSTIIYKGITSPIGIPVIKDISGSFSIGFREGYQTMDLLGATITGGIVTSSLLEKGYSDKKMRFNMTIKSSIIAGIGLSIVYGGLLYLGATSSGIIGGEIARTTLTTTMVSLILGEMGKMVLGVTVSSACLTTSVGLTAIAGDYFNEISKGKISYKLAVVTTTIISAFISNVGVERIVSLAGPMLSILYPVGIVLVIMNLLDKYIPGKKVYQGAVFATLGVSLIEGISSMGINTYFLGEVVEVLPFASSGFGWILPALIGLTISMGMLNIRNKENRGIV